jgi:tRNA-2-methylthio-N6-dimethylallyladenosine synthase
MRRGYTAEKFRKLVADLRTARPGIAITTDVIVGFPGETEEDYLATRSLMDEIGFDNAFVFRYSQRQNTPAATMEDQLPEDVKEARNKDLLEVVNRHTALKLEALVGSDLEILCEGTSRHNSERLTGRTRTNKIVVFEGSERQIGEIFPIRIVRATNSTLYGDPVIFG